MLDSLVQQFAGGGAQSMEGNELHGGVGQLLQAASGEHSSGAIGDALSMLGAGGFGNSVLQGSQTATPQQRNGLADMLLRAVSQGGGSPDSVLSTLGIGGHSMGPGELASLAEHVGSNHPSALSSVLASQLGGGGGGSGMLHLLGNPMVRQIGLSLAKRML